MKDELIIINGINGATGEYDLPPQKPADVAKFARGLPIEVDHRKDIEIRRERDASQADHLGLREGLDPTDLSQAGWGVIFPQDISAKKITALREALKPLLEFRKEQAAHTQEHFYKECIGDQGYQVGQSKSDFLKMHGRGAGPADPNKLPYYLLILGDPEAIPYNFQYQLDVQYAVGRIYFDDLEDYYRYSVSVVETEKRNLRPSSQAVFFGPANEDDRATNLSTKKLVQPLADYVSRYQQDWQVKQVLQEQAYKSQLNQILHSSEAPALLFTASHGMSFPNGDTRQMPHQGALLCQDWPGPHGHRGIIPEDFYFSADDLGESANVLGTLAFFFACFGAGTPHMDDFYRRALAARQEVAPHAFLARLPQRMLAHPRGGALAAIGHVDRAWGYSFDWEGVGQELVTFESMLDRLAEGHPVGSAMEYFNSRYAELASDLASEIDETSEEFQNTIKLAGLWTASNDARNYMIIGDPAVRIKLGKSDDHKKEHAEIVELISSRQNVSEAIVADIHVDRKKPLEDQVEIENHELSFVQFNTVDELSGEEVIKKIVSILEGYLSKALDETKGTQVATYVAEDNSAVIGADDSAHGVALRALTRIHPNGDVELIIHDDNGSRDTELLGVHNEMVRYAQEVQTERLKVLFSAAEILMGYDKGSLKGKASI